MSESNFDLTPTMPQVWYLDRAYEWHFLAPNFTTYFRMMIYHLGLPQWQLLFTPNGPTPWAKVRIPIFSKHSNLDIMNLDIVNKTQLAPILWIY